MKYVREGMALAAGFAAGLVSMGMYSQHAPAQPEPVVYEIRSVLPSDENVLTKTTWTLEDAAKKVGDLASLIAQSHPFMEVWNYVDLSSQCPPPQFTFTEALGSYQDGRLRDALMLENSPCVITQKENAHGTWELVSALTQAARDVSFAYGIPLEVYDLSRKQGGNFPPHVSHQNGLDADLAPLYFDDHEQKYKTGRFGWKQFDNSKTWEANWRLLKFLQRGALNAVFWDQKYIGKLKSHVLERHGKEEWEEYGSVLMHEDEHAGHFHVRMEKPVYLALSTLRKYGV